MKVKSLFCIAMALCFAGVEICAQKKKEQTLREDLPARNIDGLKQVVGSLELAVDGFAQTVDSLKQVVDSFMQIADSPKVAVDDPQLVSHRDSLYERCTVLVDSLRQKHQADSLKMAMAISRERDSLTAEIKRKDEMIAGFEAKINYVDTCLLKFANRALYERFDREAVNDAISYVDRIYSSGFKQEYSIVQKLLREYERSYKDFQQILREAQDDDDRINKLTFVVEEYKKRYIQEIKGMNYYKRYYGGDWNIRYLNGQIDDALKMLGIHSIEKPADFTPLIDSNF